MTEHTAQCLECKKWFPINQVVFIPVESDNFGFYLCHHDGITYYAKRITQLEQAGRKRINNIRETMNDSYANGFDIHIHGSAIEHEVAALEMSFAALLDKTEA